MAYFISGAWLLGLFAIAVALFLYFSNFLIGMSNRKLIFSLIISCLVLYLSLFTIWGWHIVALIFGAVALLLALFLSRSDIHGAYAAWLIILFLLAGALNLIQSLLLISVSLWYCIIFHFLIGVLLIVRGAIDLKK